MKVSEKHSLSNQLRNTIDSRGLTAYAVGKLADVDVGIVARFMKEERDIYFATADRLASALGLRLVEVGRRTPVVKPRRDQKRRGDFLEVDDAS